MIYFLQHIVLPFCFGILLGLLIIFIAQVLSAITVNYKNYKAYKERYDRLPHLTWHRPGKDLGLELSTIYGYFFDKKEFIYFLDTKDFKIDYENDIYLHGIENDFVKYDPIANYWCRKYRKWFDENVNI